MFWPWSKKKRRDRLRQQPFPDAWKAILERNVPYYRHLPPEDRDELHGHIHVLLAEKNFEGCGGLRMTDEIRLTIAAQAAVLLLHRDTDYYPGLFSILVYPSAFWAENVVEEGPGGLILEAEDEVRAGESWQHGAVVLAWDDVKEGARDTEDGFNVVYHEFAHQLDQENAHVDGAPDLPERRLHAEWARVMDREYTRLLDDIEADRYTLIDEYGATDPAEFFAVVTECFFEIPVRLRRHHPELYDLLKAFYRQDPAELMTRRESAST